MKAFRLKTQGEIETLSANTNIEALIYYCNLNSLQMDDECFDNNDYIEEIPETEWESIIIKNIDFNEDEPNDMPETWTLKELMENQNSVELLASTNYL